LLEEESERGLRHSSVCCDDGALLEPCKHAYVGRAQSPISFVFLHRNHNLYYNKGEQGLVPVDKYTSIFAWGKPSLLAPFFYLLLKSF
jgi:hypothetical protein